MKMLAIITLILSAASQTALTASIDGKWTSEREVLDSNGKTYKHTTTLTLKIEAGSLTGTVVQVSAAPWMQDRTGRVVEIRDGKVEGDKFSFKITYSLRDGDKTAVYEGTVQGDYMKGVVKFRGVGQTWTFDAKRAD